MRARPHAKWIGFDDVDIINWLVTVLVDAVAKRLFITFAGTVDIFMLILKDIDCDKFCWRVTDVGEGDKETTVMNVNFQGTTLNW